MSYHVTLRRLRNAKPKPACEDRYNHLVAGLDGFGDDDPIDLGFVLDRNGVEDGIWALRATVENCEKGARLFGAAWTDRNAAWTDRNAAWAAWDAAWTDRNAAWTDRNAAWAAWDAAWIARAAARNACAVEREKQAEFFRKYFC